MFTVKILKQELFTNEGGPTLSDGSKPTCYKQVTKLIEASEVEIHTHQHGRLYGISGVKGNGAEFYYYIADPDRPYPENIQKTDTGTGEHLFGYAAYIENAAGATTHVVKF